MDEQEMSQEMEELLSQDPTPEVTRTYRHSKEFYQKKLREAEKEQRAKEKLEGANTKDRVAQYRSEHLALFESVPQIVAITWEEMVSSARLFARLLRMDDARQGIDFRLDYIPPAETARQFCTRIFHRWAEGITVGILAPHHYRFPLVNLGQENGDRTEAFFALFDWLPDNDKVLSEDPVLPTSWPVGSDDVLDLRNLPECLGEPERREARKQLQTETRQREVPRTIAWTLNRVTGYQEPHIPFVRLSRQEELLRYRMGFRYYAGEFPELRPCPDMVSMSLRATEADLQSFIEQDYLRVTEELQRRQS